MGGLFSIFHKKSALKPPKWCGFAYFTSQWGGLEPPRPPLATILSANKLWFPKQGTTIKLIEIATICKELAKGNIINQLAT